MPRNGSGTYSLPAGNPVVTGTTIQSTWANNTLTDLASALTGSLPRDGQAAMTGSLPMGGQDITNAGAVTGSGAFTGARVIVTGSTVPPNGMYLPSANVLGFSAGSALGMSMSASGVLTVVGGAVVTAGGLTVTAGGLTVTAGSLSFPAASIADAALSANVPLKNAANTFTAAQIVSIAAAGQGIALNVASGWTGLKFQNAGTDRWSILSDYDAAGELALYSHSTAASQVRFAAGGNVTINAPSSGTPLVVNSGALGTSIQAAGDAGASLQLVFAQSGQNAGAIVNPASSDAIDIYAAGGQRVRVLNGIQLGSPTGGDKGAGTLNTAGAIYQNGTLVQDSGSFTGTFTGLSGSVTGTVRWVRAGNAVTMEIPGVTGTSNAATFTMTGVPAALRPSVSTGTFWGGSYVDGGSFLAAPPLGLNLNTSGVVTFYKGDLLSASTWTASSTKAITNAPTFTYLLN